MFIESIGGQSSLRNLVCGEPDETTRPLFVDFYYFLEKKGKCFKLYV
jgi:hypothetical protein